jgi:hypothetical protein
MRINKTLPKRTNLLQHDAPVLRVVRIALIAFILISSITVFLGVRVHIHDYLQSLSPIVRFPAYSIAYVLFSLVPDTLSVILFAFVIRSFLKGHFSDGLSIILVTTCSLMMVFLVRYSWNMSRNAAHSYALFITPEPVTMNTATIEDRSQDRVRDIEAVYQREVKLVRDRYDELVLASIAPQKAASAPLEEQMMRLEKNRTDQNTYWTDREIRKLQWQLSPIEQKIASIRKELTIQKNAELAALKRSRDQRIAAIEQNAEMDRSTALEENEAAKTTTNSISAVLKRELKQVAGFAIFIVLLLTGLTEILYHRNGIDREPIVAEFNLRSSMASEVINLPVVFLGRYLINWVRKRYEQLPDLQPSPQNNTIAIKGPLNVVKATLNGTEHPTQSTDNQSLNCFNPTNDYDHLFTEEVRASESDHDDRRQNGLSSHDDRALLKENMVPGKYLRECAYDDCTNTFFPNAPKHIYCDADCRRAAWEKKTGKTLKYKPKIT